MQQEWQFDIRFIKAMRDEAEKICGERLTLEAVESVLQAAMTNHWDWKFVPVEANIHMLKAATNLVDNEDLRHVYAVMVANAPEAA